MHIKIVLFTFLVFFLTAPNGGLALKEEVIPDLHSRACVGLPFDSIHLQNTCIVDVRLRATCAEIQRFFQTLNKTYTPGTFSDLPELLRKRIKQEPAIQHGSAGDNLCVNIELPLPVSKCPVNFLEFENNCYVATQRRVSYLEAKEECAMIRGSLVEENTPKIVELLNYLVEYYIHDSIFTGFDRIINKKIPKQEGFLVEANFQSGELQYIPPTSSRPFMCVVPTGIFTVPLYQSIPLPSTPDIVVIHDIDTPSIPNIPNFEKYLADLFEFKYFANESSRDGYMYRVDLLESPPENSTYSRSLGSLILPKHNSTQLSKSISKVCDQFSLLYRVHSNITNKEVLTLYPKLFTKDENLIYNALGYCSIYEGYCGTSVPIYENPRHTKNVEPICYGYKFDRNLDLELELHMPFRYAQIAHRIEPVFMTYYSEHFNTHYHRVPNSSGPKSNKVFQLINPLHIQSLNYYCAEQLKPLYRVVDYVNDNSMLILNKTALDYFRQRRDQYEEEELLGYCAETVNYCGASLPIHHYIVFHEYAHHKDDVYLPVQARDHNCVDCDKSYFQQTLCYGF